MADISMCQNKLCEKKDECYRYNAPVNPYRQSYASFDYTKDPSCFIIIHHPKTTSFRL